MNEDERFGMRRVGRWRAKRPLSTSAKNPLGTLAKMFGGGGMPDQQDMIDMALAQTLLSVRATPPPPQHRRPPRAPARSVTRAAPHA